MDFGQRYVLTLIMQNIRAFWIYSIFEENCQSSSEDDSRDEQSENFCDTCERAFYSHEQLQRHLQEHRVCGIDGCAFVAHAKVVEKHIEMQHITGLYYRIKKTETPEDVAKWIQERKRNYPSKENIEKRQKEQQEMLKRGERIPKPNNRFGKKNKKVLGKPEFPYRKKIQSAEHLERIQKRKKPPTISLVTSKDSWNGNLPPFGGTAELYESEVQELDTQINDDEWMSEKNEKVQITLNNALGALIGAYRSSDESDEDIIVPKNNVPDTVNIEVDKVHVENEIKAELECEQPEEVKIKREEVTELSNIDTKNVCNNEKNFRKRKRNHRNKHTAPRNIKEQNTNVENKRPFVKHRKITLLERLLEPEIRHERNVLLQCIRYVVQNNFFDKLVSVPRNEDVQ